MATVTLREMTENLGLDRSNGRKWLLEASKRLGLAPVKVRTSSGRGQMALAWSADDAKRLIDHRITQGYAVGGGTAGVSDNNGQGTFYMLRIVPELCPRRIKAGFADSLEQRIRDHRCTAPTAELLQTWPCKRPWEPAALACLSVMAAKSHSNEVFDIDDPSTAVERLGTFFSMLPAI
jgi:hypothetical protein